MAKYLIKANYAGDGITGLMNEGGTKRKAAAEAAIQSVGGTLESMYYAFGDTDVYAIGDFPDAATAAAASLLVNSTGAVSLSLTPLLTVEDMDAAAAKGGSYTPPGG
ncbi:MAG: GYD domain-containing protein [Acidimicrobiales bacterium]|nr:GYD domain-containing protein [Acidimicrobiales bacterium]